MQKVTHSRFFAYGVSIIAVLLAFVLMLVLDPWLSMVKSPFLLFWGAIVISAWYGGLKPGLLATLVSVILSDYFFLEPRYAITIGFPELVRLGLYILQGTVISFICDALLRAKRRAEVNLGRLKVSEERFKLALSNSNIQIFQQNQDLKYLWIHTSSGKVSQEEIYGKSDDDFFNEVEAKHLTTIKEKALLSGEPVRAEVRVTFGNQPNYYDLFVQPIQTSNKHIGGITCVAVNITERKQIEQQLKSATQQSTQILESITDAFFALDKTWRFSYVNRHFEEVTQLSKEELLGRCIWDVFPQMMTSVFYEKLPRALNQNEAITIEANSPINSNHWIEARAYPSTEGLSVYWQDITARKQAEIERNQLLMREQAAREKAELMQKRLAFLDTANSMLAASLDYETTLEAVVNLIVPELADVCGLDIIQQDRSVNPLIALKAKDQAEEELIRHFTRLYPLNLDNQNQPITRVFYSGVPEALYEITDAHYQGIAQDAQHLEYLRQLKVKSAICVPLRAYEQVFGVMTLMFTKSGRQYTPDDLMLAVQLGQRVGLAIENSRLHHQLQQATRKQQESLALLNAWLESSPVGMAFVNTELRYIYANNALAAINGIPLNEHIGRTFWEIMPLWASQLAPIFEQVMTTKQPLLNQELCGETNPSGVFRYCLVNYYPVCLEDGQVLGVGATVIDVSELKKAEIARTQLLEALEAKQKLLEAVIQQMPAGLAVVEAKTGRIILQNEQLRQILENKPLLTAQPDNEENLYQVYRPDGQLYNIAELPLMRSRQQGEVVQGEEMLLLWPDGRRKILLVDSTPIRNTTGQIEAAVATFYDITELHQQREQIQIYADIVENVQIGICVWQLEDFNAPGSLRLISANPASSQIVGIDFMKLIGQTMQESFPHFMKTNIPQEYAQIIKTGQGKTLEELDYGDEEIPAAIFSIKSFPLPNNCIGLAFENITDRKRTEKELKNREEQLRLAVEGANLGMWNYDLLTGELIWSTRCKRIFGLSPDTTMTYDIFINALHPEDREKVDQAVQQAITQGKNYDIEMRTQWPDSTVHWVRSIGHAYYNNQSVAYRMAGVALDITQQKLAQEALRQSEERFRVAQELSLDAFTVLKSIRDETGKIIDFECRYVNPTAARILNKSIDELTGKRLLEILPGSQTETPLFDRYVQVVETGKPHDIELYYDSDQIRAWFRNMAVKLDDGVAVSWSDITERKRAEETLRENEQRLNIALRTAKLGSWQLDLSSMKLDSSAQCKANFGLSFDRELSYSQLFELIHPEDRDYVSRSIQQAIQTHTDYESEFRCLWPDGSIHWILAQGSVLYGKSSIPLRMIGVTLDITSRKQAQAEQERLLEREKAARSEAERVNRIKDEFLAVLSHELRSPLNPILGWAQLLRTNSFDEANQKRALEIIERNAKLQAQLIEDLLDVSRILRGKLTLNVAPVNLVIPISGAIETVRLSAEAKSIEIQTLLASDVGKIAGDAGRIQQIVWNLLSNAIKFTPEGGLIKISLERVNNQAKITVKDTGKGIDSNFLPYVFEHFRQADSTTTRKFGGLGLGLAIVRHLVEMHGGTVAAESLGEGQGSTFTVTFPLVKDESKNISAEDVNNFLPDATNKCLKGIRILAVDDDSDMRDYVIYVLEQSEAVVRVAASAKEALDILVDFKPDILLSDIGMPNVDGYMLLRQIRAMLPKQEKIIPAIALTAYAGEYDQRCAIAAGFKRHLPKPVEPEQLVKAIVDLLGF